MRFLIVGADSSRGNLGREPHASNPLVAGAGAAVPILEAWAEKKSMPNFGLISAAQISLEGEGPPRFSFLVSRSPAKTLDGEKMRMTRGTLP